MVMGLFSMLIVSSGMFAFVLFVLLLIMVMQPPPKKRNSVKEDLKSIKKQVDEK